MQTTGSKPWRDAHGGLVVRVRLTPKGGRDEIGGVASTPEGPAIKARVRAAPENGAANAALEALVADTLGLPKREVGVIAGHKSRTKSIAIAASTPALQSRLAELIAQS